MNEHQKSQREATIKKALAAAERLKKQGKALTFRAIAKEAGLSISTVVKTDVKLALEKEYSISKSKEECKHERDVHTAEIEHFKEQLNKSRNANSLLREQNTKLKKERDEWERKYRYLLFKYATNIDKTITPI